MAFALLAIPALHSFGLPVRVSAVLVEKTSPNPSSPVPPSLSRVIVTAKPASQEEGRGALEVPLEASQEIVLNLAPGVWSFAASAEGFWGPGKTTFLDSETAAIVLQLWPTGRLKGTLRVPDKEAPPKELKVHFRPTPEVGTIVPPSAVICPVDLETAVWQCELPEGQLDLRVEAEGFIPVHRVGVLVGAGEHVHVGFVDLVPGSMIFGWVRGSESGPGIDGTGEVLLRPRGPQPNRLESDRLEVATRKTQMDEHGYFQFEGVPPGTYELEARQEPYIPTIETVSVRSRETIEITEPPLVLDLPLALTIQVRPPQDPWGHRWLVRLIQFDSVRVNTVGEVERAMEADGSIQIMDLSPGPYLLQVLAAGGDDSWYSKSFDLKKETESLLVEIPIVSIRGKLFLGKEPLAATVWFGTRWGSEKIALDSDAEGGFEGSIPRGGQWDVGIYASSPKIDRVLKKVDVEPNDRGEAELELRIPNTVVTGEVFLEDGSATRARIDAQSLLIDENSGRLAETLNQIATDDYGWFDLRGLPPGLVRIRARGPSSESDSVEVLLVEDLDPGPLKLVIRKKVVISGRVMSPSGPVAGAQVFALVGSGALPPTAVSDAAGRIDLAVPAGAHYLNLVIAAEGFALQMLGVELRAGSTISAMLGQESGDLVLEGDLTSNKASGTAGQEIMLGRNGAYVPIHVFDRWARKNGVESTADRFVVPNLEPGEYRVCLAHSFAETEAYLNLRSTPGKSCYLAFVPQADRFTLSIESLRNNDPKESGE